MASLFEDPRGSFRAVDSFSRRLADVVESTTLDVEHAIPVDDVIFDSDNEEVDTQIDQMPDERNETAEGRIPEEQVVKSAEDRVLGEQVGTSRRVSIQDAVRHVIVLRDITTRFSTGITREAMEAEAEAAREEINSFIRHDSAANVNKRLGEEEEVKRSKARDELLSSEEVYYSRLLILTGCFFRPLLSFIAQETSTAVTNADGLAESPTLQSAEKVRQVFSNIQQIEAFTKQLLDELRSAHAEDRPLGPVFVRFAPFFRLYTDYYRGYELALESLDDLQKLYWFHCFLTAVERQPVCHKLLLRDFLIEPIQRVPRYEILLKALVKYTPTDDTNYSELQQAVVAVQAVAKDMNEKLNEREQREKVRDWSGRWGVDFSNPARKFLKEGMLVKTDRHGKAAAYHFVLFNDILVYGDEVRQYLHRSSDTTKYHMRFKCGLRDCVVIDSMECSSFMGKYGQNDRFFQIAVQDEETLRRLEHLDEHSFMIKHPKKNLLLRAESEAEKREWVNILSDALVVLRETNPHMVEGQEDTDKISGSLMDRIRRSSKSGTS